MSWYDLTSRRGLPRLSPAFSPFLACSLDSQDTACRSHASLPTPPLSQLHPGLSPDPRAQHDHNKLALPAPTSPACPTDFFTHCHCHSISRKAQPRHLGPPCHPAGSLDLLPVSQAWPRLLSSQSGISSLATIPCDQARAAPPLCSLGTFSACLGGMVPCALVTVYCAELKPV